MDQLKNYIPFTTFFLITGSSLKLITYYSNFGINIISYMDISEFSFTFLEDIYSYIFVFGGFLMWTIIDDVFTKASEEIDIEEKRRKYFYKLTVTFFIIYGCQTFCKIFFVNTIVLSVAIFTVFLVCVIFILRYAKFDKQSKYFTLIPTFLFISYLQANLNIAKIEENQVFQEKYKITVFQKTLITNSKIIMLGRIKNYTFLYDKESNSTKVYHNKDILEFQISI
ncbi:hypothetical protein C9994_14285 [Marivirga lumbricoides]|uniref:Uncharacterized protein n=1 Tax=Marivirga lumbricoides TaxID=1046115 RepID=A0A2T4DEQ0_9BACT|nr:hypothetical protein C9994_14285 [Marivirga lumbricoides]